MNFAEPDDLLLGKPNLKQTALLDEQKLIGSRRDLAKAASIKFSTGIYSVPTHLKHGCSTIRMHPYSY